MSTKNLARTVIEGGRAGYSKYKRRNTLQKMRTKNARVCYDMLRGYLDPDEATWPARGRGFDLEIAHADKVNPCDRFLLSRVGRHWNDVRSEICRRFDRRTLAGMHVVTSHLLHVEDGRSRHVRIDGNGILRSR